MRAEVVSRAIAHALAAASGLGAFTVAVGVLGIKRAVLLCETRRPPAALKQVWEELGYSVEQLPTSENIRLFFVGVEARQAVAIALSVARANKTKAPLAEIVKKLDHSYQDVVLGLRLVRAYGVDPNHPYLEELGVI